MEKIKQWQEKLKEIALEMVGASCKYEFDNLSQAQLDHITSCYQEICGAVGALELVLQSLQYPGVETKEDFKKEVIERQSEDTSIFSADYRGTTIKIYFYPGEEAYHWFIYRGKMRLADSLKNCGCQKLEDAVTSAKRELDLTLDF